jgi:hypothetical protein
MGRMMLGIMKARTGVVDIFVAMKASIFRRTQQFAAGGQQTIQNQPVGINKT